MDAFVYGTLTDPERARGVLAEFEYAGPAVLEGLHRVDGEYPTLVPGGSVEGRILRTGDAAALDRYEGVESGLYVRVSVPLAADSGDDDRDRTVETYVGDPERLDAPAEWPGEGAFAERVRSFVRAEDVRIRQRDGTFAEFDGYDGDEPTGASTDHNEWGVE
ncbi:gamma-glutamylcyclotransferase [Halosimplex pelagicum]|uniref:Gamma-glutamylcyclotransferase n=1 Tax=Halosimplex pelagicum TaxID=869886 RepID=A0A7D5T8D0_9EURY|nr:gamma-glutamylcyclotransferase family protein [Halosimplex pelagicum]QLH80850.1 gamma-glutamylcyclotransferase [Halosimplex pelagicum]